MKACLQLQLEREREKIHTYIHTYIHTCIHTFRLMYEYIHDIYIYANNAHAYPYACMAIGMLVYTYKYYCIPDINILSQRHSYLSAYKHTYMHNFKACGFLEFPYFWSLCISIYLKIMEIWKKGSAEILKPCLFAGRHIRMCVCMHVNRHTWSYTFVFVCIYVGRHAWGFMYICMHHLRGWWGLGGLFHLDINSNSSELCSKTNLYITFEGGCDMGGLFHLHFRLHLSYVHRKIYIYYARCFLAP